MNTNIKKIVLAYSGGLDTSIIIPWLKENYKGAEVIACACDVGLSDELDGLEEKALKTGADKLIICDLKDEYVNDYIIKTMQAGARYETYLLGTSHARPLIAKALCEVAKKEGADAIAHGATGKGNDQVRFEMGIKHFLPDIKIIAPWREWDIKSREEEIDYAESHNVPLKINRETNYSKDKNLWHLSHEGLDLEDVENEPKYDEKGFLELSVSPMNAPDTPEIISIHFEKGVPVKYNNKSMTPREIVEELNKVGGKHGIGIIDIVENRLIGMKVRGVYETPGGTILYRAHEELESLVLDKEVLHEKQKLSVDYADLVSNGIEIVVYTKEENDDTARLRQQGIDVVSNKNLSLHTAIIDKSLIWYGSVKILGFHSGEDNLIRFKNPEIATSLLASLPTRSETNN